MAIAYSARVSRVVRRAIGRSISQPWIVAVLASAVIYVVLLFLSSKGGSALLSTNLFLASFVAITGLGQMLVIMTGRGAIDLSIPNTVTLCVYVATIIQNNSNGTFVVSVIVTLLVGGVIGAMNGLAVTGLRIPAMVATLAVGFIVESITQVISTFSGHSGASPIISRLAGASLFGIPDFLLITVAIAILVAILIHRTGYGLRLGGVGQNDVAGLYAQLRPKLTRFIAFVLSGILASVAAVLLGGYSGGASLGVGDGYLLSSIAAVVIGGTLISGGIGTAAGTFIGAAMLTLLLTLTNTINLTSGERSIIEGLIILAALAVPRLTDQGRTKSIRRAEQGTPSPEDN